jgi:hypothetical protein
MYCTFLCTPGSPDRSPSSIASGALGVPALPNNHPYIYERSTTCMVTAAYGLNYQIIIN